AAQGGVGGAAQGGVGGAAQGGVGGAAQGGAGAPAPACPDCCSDSFERGTANPAVRKLANFTPSPEGVAVCPNGEVFVALDGSGELWHVPLSAAPPEKWASLGDRRPAGLTCDEQGRLFVAIFSTLSGATAPLSVLMVSERDATPVALPASEDGTAVTGLNGIVAVPGIGVYASDTSGNLIFLTQESAPGTFTTRVVARDVALANGLAYDPAGPTLYAVASGAGLYTYPIAADGSLGTRETVSVARAILFTDGVAVDETGEAYVADYLGGAVVRASDGDRVARLTNPASLAFRGGTLLVSDYRVMAPEAEGGLYAVDLGVCGAHPGQRRSAR
ncbi:MAG: SMP-30/gluconolactonase/LRE family protein, partial [Polyangiales bacterium]